MIKVPFLKIGLGDASCRSIGNGLRKPVTMLVKLKQCQGQMLFTKDQIKVKGAVGARSP